MKASKAREMFEKVNRPLTLKEKIRQHANKGYAGMSVDRMIDNDPKLKKLQKKGYLITHSDSKTYITWSY